ncbi:hypothetical protein GALL_188890 [mine drainage metagenome]|uniref:Uncharacterized protein n=1 Tax=mine drainage metagenome TaxID=410659 RepID=A0A1J5S4W0_9ZZZZ
MEIDLFGSFQDDADKKGIVFYYSGALSQNVIATMGDILKQRLDNNDAKSAVTKKLFSSFIEMIQNALHYSPLVPDSSSEKIGAVAVGKVEDHFYIVCGNLVDKKYISRITSKIEAVNSMSRDEVKQAYRMQLKNDHHSDDDISKGAGLGLLTLARDSISPIEYSFKDVSGYENEYSELHLKTIF